MESAGDRTSSVTVFTVPPRNITLEIGEQFLRRLERISGFLSGKVPVVTLPSLIVVTENAFPRYDVRKPILELT